jgi:hypothetical protein
MVDLIDSDIIKELTCPITNDLCEDPVRIGNHVFERVAIERWFDQCGAYPTNPLTREPVTTTVLKTDKVLKEIADIIRKKEKNAVLTEVPSVDCVIGNRIKEGIIKPSFAPSAPPFSSFISSLPLPVSANTNENIKPSFTPSASPFSSLNFMSSSPVPVPVNINEGILPLSLPVFANIDRGILPPSLPVFMPSVPQALLQSHPTNMGFFKRAKGEIKEYFRKLKEERKEYFRKLEEERKANKRNMRIGLIFHREYKYSRDSSDLDCRIYLFSKIDKIDASEISSCNDSYGNPFPSIDLFQFLNFTTMLINKCDNLNSDSGKSIVEKIIRYSDPSSFRNLFRKIPIVRNNYFIPIVECLNFRRSTKAISTLIQLGADVDEMEARGKHSIEIAYKMPVISVIRILYSNTRMNPVPFTKHPLEMVIDLKLDEYGYGVKQI